MCSFGAAIVAYVLHVVFLLQAFENGFSSACNRRERAYRKQDFADERERERERVRERERARERERETERERQRQRERGRERERKRARCM